MWRSGGGRAQEQAGWQLPSLGRIERVGATAMLSHDSNDQLPSVNKDKFNAV